MTIINKNAENQCCIKHFKNINNHSFLFNQKHFYEKNIFFLCLFCGFALVNINCQAQNKKTIPIIHGTGNAGNPTGLETDVPFVSAEYDADDLTIFIENYAGNADILIMRNFGHQVVYDSTDYLSPLSPVEIDISGYSAGSYSIYILLDGGEMYSGEFLIE